MRGISILLMFLWLPLGCYITAPPENLDPLTEGKEMKKNPSVSLKELDIPKTLRIALGNNPDYGIVFQRIKQVRGMHIQADSAFFPQVGLQVRYFHADSPLAFLGTKLDQRKLSLAGNLNNPGDFGSGRVSLGVQYQLNLGGAEFFNRFITRLEVEISRHERDKVLNVLVSSVIEVYYNILASKKYLQIAEESVKTVSSQLRETSLKFKGGSALKSDVLSLEVRLASTKEEVIRARNRHHLLTNSLAVLMGLDPGAEITLKEKDWEPGVLPENYEKAVLVALKNRPEISVALKRYHQGEYQRRLALSRYFPNIEAFGNYYFEDRDFSYSIKRDNWQVGMGLSMSLFDGLRTYGAVKTALGKKGEAYLAYRKTLLQIKHQVKRAYRNLEEAKERVQVLSLAVKQAEENLSLVKKQFEGGAATITKYLDGELALKSSRFQLTSAQYDLKKARVNIGHALGLCGQCTSKL